MEGVQEDDLITFTKNGRLTSTEISFGRPTIYRQLFLDEPGPSCSTSNSSRSLVEMRPLLFIQRSTQNKRKKASVSIISSTTIKNQLQEKEKNSSRKGEKRTRKFHQKKEVFIFELSQSSVYFSLMCHEPYTEPPVEDWIQCDICLVVSRKLQQLWRWRKIRLWCVPI